MCGLGWGGRWAGWVVGVGRGHFPPGGAHFRAVGGRWKVEGEGVGWDGGWGGVEGGWGGMGWGEHFVTWPTRTKGGGASGGPCPSLRLPALGPATASAAGLSWASRASMTCGAQWRRRAGWLARCA